MGKRHAPKVKGKPFDVNKSIDYMLRTEEKGKKKVSLSKAMTRPAYAYTKAEQKQIYKTPVCETCGYYREPDISSKKDCCFPWLEPEDYDLAAYDYLPCKEGLTYEEN